MTFHELELSEQILRAIKEEGYETATPIQSAAIPPILDGRDLLGCAQTGTGKTAAFALPTIHRLSAKADKSQPHRIRALILAPTRELATQIGESFRTYGKHSGLRTTVIFGGVGQSPQVKHLQRGVDILVATPGRLWDLMQQGHVRLRDVEVLILDEADQMLDMGFIHDLRRIVAKTPEDRQTLMFSATMPPEIRSLASEWLIEPALVEVAPQGTTIDRIAQSVFFVPTKQAKAELLVDYVRKHATSRTIVFTRTKHGADKLVRFLSKSRVRAEAIHGNKSQNARQIALAKFKGEHPPLLIATDIAARGLDIDGVSHVVNFDLPMTPELYVHRIGRTARAGASGVAVMFCAPDERSMLKEIERLTRQRIPTATYSAKETRGGGAPLQDVEEAEADGIVPGEASWQAQERRPQHQQRRPQQPRNGQQGRSQRSHGTQTQRPAFGDGIMSAVGPGGEMSKQQRLARRRRRRSAADARGGLPPTGGPNPGYRGPKYKKRTGR